MPWGLEVVLCAMLFCRIFHWRPNRCQTDQQTGLITVRLALDDQANERYFHCLNFCFFHPMLDPRELTQLEMKTLHRGKKSSSHKWKEKAYKIGRIAHTHVGIVASPKIESWTGWRVGLLNDKSNPFFVNLWLELELKSRKARTLNWSLHEQSWLICIPLPICLCFCKWPIHGGKTSIEQQYSCYLEQNTYKPTLRFIWTDHRIGPSG